MRNKAGVDGAEGGGGRWRRPLPDDCRRRSAPRPALCIVGCAVFARATSAQMRAAETWGDLDDGSLAASDCAIRPKNRAMRARTSVFEFSGEEEEAPGRRQAHHNQPGIVESKHEMSCALTE